MHSSSRGKPTQTASRISTNPRSTDGRTQIEIISHGVEGLPRSRECTEPPEPASGGSVNRPSDASGVGSAGPTVASAEPKLNDLVCWFALPPNLVPGNPNSIHLYSRCHLRWFRTTVDESEWPNSPRENSYSSGTDLRYLPKQAPPVPDARR